METGGLREFESTILRRLADEMKEIACNTTKSKNCVTDIATYKLNRPRGQFSEDIRDPGMILLCG